MLRNNTAVKMKTKPFFIFLIGLRHGSCIFCVPNKMVVFVAEEIQLFFQQHVEFLDEWYLAKHDLLWILARVHHRVFWLHHTPIVGFLHKNTTLVVKR